MVKHVRKRNIPLIFGALFTIYVTPSFGAATFKKKSPAWSEISNKTSIPVRISGQVTDAVSSIPLPGVTVTVKGTARATTTDVNGAYDIDASEADVLLFSFIGYAPQEVKVGAGTLLNVQLKPDAGSLNEVVVVGYGTQRKGNIT